MDDKKTIIITVALSLTMVLMFVGVIIFVNVKKNELPRAELGSGDRKLSSDATIQLDDDIEYEAVDVSDKVVTIEDVGADEDIREHSIEVESTYINTTELLPSLWKKREKVAKERVDISGFPDSYALNDKKTITLGKAQVGAPKEVYLYNTRIEKSSSYKVTLSVEDPDSVIKSIGWVSPNSVDISLSAQAGESSVISYVGTNFSGTVPISIIITYAPEAGRTVTEELTFDVIVENVSYANEQLKDLQGNLLYLNANGEKPAYVSDYASKDYFYGEIKTTGWQEIDGSKYYFNGNSDPVKGHQIIGGLPYEFDDNGVLLSDVGEFGIDVSKWQKDIDWQQVAASGVDFAIIRCGFRASQSAQLVEDPYFRTNVKGALANGIKVGVYFFTQAVNEKEAIEEASMAIAMSQGYDITLPIYIDSEAVPNGRANDLDRATRTRCLQAFCETVNNSGFEGGVYASKNWYYDQLYADSLEQYNIWVAQYNTECNYKGKADFWQYSSKETIAGIVGYVDVNVVRKN